MSIDRKCMGDIKAPEGKFAVYEWDPSNPEKSTPVVARVLSTGKDAIFAVESYAAKYAGIRNDKWYREMQRAKAAGQLVIGETEYFVLDDKGVRR